MGNYKKKLSELKKDANHFLWDYYYSFGNNVSVCNEIFNNPKKNIKSFMEKSGKSIDKEIRIGTKSLSIESIKKDRLKHIVSIFFLGVYIYENCEKLQTEINSWTKSKIVIVEEISTRTDFYYFWFLTCFYHDLGYTAEDNNNAKDYLTRQQINETVELLFDSNNSNEYPKTVFNAELVLNYLHYRNYKDHGIIGGIRYFIDRNSEYEKKKNEIDNGRSSFIDRKTNLVWSDQIVEKVHKSIARSIILHNIWFCKGNSEDIELYKHHGLGNLIIDEPKISTDHIFLYFLQIIDTIDPSKYKCDLDNIDIFVDNSVIEITGSKNDMYWLNLKAISNETKIRIEIPN